MDEYCSTHSLPGSYIKLVFIFKPQQILIPTKKAITRRTGRWVRIRFLLDCADQKNMFDLVRNEHTRVFWSVIITTYPSWLLIHVRIILKRILNKELVR